MLMPIGKFIAIEGIDGAGKRTQLDLLSKLLDERKVQHVRISFPRYDSFFGKMVGQFLDGQFGSLQEVDAHFSALLYAGDRLEASKGIGKHLEEMKTVLADRYVASNLAHQTARVKPQQREEFLKWLKKLEYEVYGLPKEDVVIYLRLPAPEAQRLVGKKAARGYTERQHDILEADLRHLEQAAMVYDRLSRESNWVTVECFDLKAGALRSPEEIHKALVTAVDARDRSLLRPVEMPKFGPQDPPRI